MDSVVEDKSPLWMFLCDKMNKSKNTNSQIRKLAEKEGIDPKGKNRKDLCRELAKIYYEKLKVEGGGEIKSEKKQDLGKIKLAKLIDNSDGKYRNYFEVRNIDEWEVEKSPYDFHRMLYSVKNLEVIKENEQSQKKLNQFQTFPNLEELISILIISIESMPNKDRQRYVMSLKNLFINQEIKEEDEDRDYEYGYEYDYEDEYGIFR